MKNDRHLSGVSQEGSQEPEQTAARQLMGLAQRATQRSERGPMGLRINVRRYSRLAPCARQQQCVTVPEVAPDGVAASKLWLRLAGCSRRRPSSPARVWGTRAGDPTRAAGRYSRPCPNRSSEPEPLPSSAALPQGDPASAALP